MLIHTAPLLVHGPAGPADLAVYRPVVHRSQFRAVSRQSIQSVRVADRRSRERADVHQRLHDAQQSLVLTWCLHASGLRHLAPVFETDSLHYLFINKIKLDTSRKLLFN